MTMRQKLQINNVMEANVFRRLQSQYSISGCRCVDNDVITKLKYLDLQRFDIDADRISRFTIY